MQGILAHDRKAACSQIIRAGLQRAHTEEPWQITKADRARVQGIDAQDHKSCDTDEGGCGTLNPVQCFLEGMPPPMFTLQLAWESHNESTEAISEVMDAVQEVGFPVYCCLLSSSPVFLLAIWLRVSRAVLIYYQNHVKLSLAMLIPVRCMSMVALSSGH